MFHGSSPLQCIFAVVIPSYSQVLRQSGRVPGERGRLSDAGESRQENQTPHSYHARKKMELVAEPNFSF
jgi:hypothetical protein